MPKRPHGTTLSRPQAPAGAPRRKTPRKAATVPTAASLSALDGELGDTLQDAKRATERRRARLMEIEYQLRRGELVSKSDADKTHFAAARILRDRIIGLAPRIAASAFAAATLPDCQRILDRELRRALETIADEIDAQPLV